MIPLTETRSLILSAAAQRPSNLALPLPKGLVGAAAKMAVTKIIERGWLQEVEANLQRGDPLWRETGNGHGTTLAVIDAGLLAVGIELMVVRTMAAIRAKGRRSPSRSGRHPVPAPSWRCSSRCCSGPTGSRWRRSPPQRNG